MGVHVIKIPDIGEGIAEVELVAWHVKPGDDIVEDQGLADVMTDKATVEIPSPVHGKVLVLGGEIGQLMAVGSELIRIEVEGEGKGSEAAKPASAPAAVAPSPSPASVPPSQRSPGGGRSEAPRAPGDKPIASPSVRRRAWELGVDLAQMRGSGTAGRITHADLDGAAASTARVPQPKRASAMKSLGPGDIENIPVIGMRRKIAQKMQ
ncbi:MAG TPA: biotin/lipoyl-containing protein, partial [Sphingomonas sp.]|nr:biotin/lipoyl-containing protein [Sphingomonas sp.]